MPGSGAPDRTIRDTVQRVLELIALFETGPRRGTPQPAGRSTPSRPSGPGGLRRPTICPGSGRCRKPPGCPERGAGCEAAQPGRCGNSRHRNRTRVAGRHGRTGGDGPDAGPASPGAHPAPHGPGRGQVLCSRRQAMHPHLTRVKGWWGMRNTAGDIDNIPGVSGNTAKGIDNTPGVAGP